MPVLLGHPDPPLVALRLAVTLDAPPEPDLRIGFDPDQVGQPVRDGRCAPRTRLRGSTTGSGAISTIGPSRPVDQSVARKRAARPSARGASSSRSSRSHQSNWSSQDAKSSVWTTGAPPSARESRRAKTDFPAPPKPSMATRRTAPARVPALISAASVAKGTTRRSVTTCARSAGHVRLVVDLGALEAAAEVDVDRLPLGVRVERGVAGLAVAVAGLLPAAEREVRLGAGRARR